MSILIKGMRLPESCGKCPLSSYQMHTGRTICKVTRKALSDNFGRVSFAGRHYGCPLVEVEDEEDETL